MLLHMIDVHRPQSAISTIDFGTVAPKTVTYSSGSATTAASRPTPSAEQDAIMTRGETREPTSPPTAQPTVIASQ